MKLPNPCFGLSKYFFNDITNHNVVRTAEILRNQECACTRNKSIVTPEIIPGTLSGAQPF